MTGFYYLDRPFLCFNFQADLPATCERIPEINHLKSDILIPLVYQTQSNHITCGEHSFTSAGR